MSSLACLKAFVLVSPCFKVLHAPLIFDVSLVFKISIAFPRDTETLSALNSFSFSSFLSFVFLFLSVVSGGDASEGWEENASEGWGENASKGGW